MARVNPAGFQTETLPSGHNAHDCAWLRPAARGTSLRSLWGRRVGSPACARLRCSAGCWPASPPSRPPARRPPNPFPRTIRRIAIAAAPPADRRSGRGHASPRRKAGASRSARWIRMSRRGVRPPKGARRFHSGAVSPRRADPPRPRAADVEGSEQAENNRAQKRERGDKRYDFLAKGRRHRGLSPDRGFVVRRAGPAAAGAPFV